MAKHKMKIGDRVVRADDHDGNGPGTITNVFTEDSLFHTVSSQNFRSFCFLPFFLLFYLSKIVQLNFFREIATYTSRLLSFDKFSIF